MKRNTILLITILTVITMLSCSYENTATVTIDTGIRKQAQLSLLDKLIAWISFSNALQADPPPNDNFNVLELRITAADMSPIVKRYTYTELYDNNGKITLEVPAGNQRLFTVIAGYLEAEEIYDKVYGGITTIDLSPGQNVNLNIEIGELFVFTSFSYTDYRFDIYTQKQYFPIAFNIYKQVEGKWVFYDSLDVGTYFNEICSGECSYSSKFDYHLSSGYNYGIKGVNRYGEGEMYEFDW